MQIYEIGLSSLLVKDYFHKFIWREAHHELTTCKQVVLESLVEAILRMRALNSYIKLINCDLRVYNELCAVSYELSAGACSQADIFI